MFEADAIGRGTMPRPTRMHRRPANLGRIRAIATRPIRSTAGRHPAGRHPTGGRNIRPRMRRSSRHPARAVRGHRAARRTRASVALVGTAPADLAPADLAPVGMAPADPAPGAHGGSDETGRLRAADGTELQPLDLDLTGSRTSRSRQSRRAEAEQTAEARKSRAGRNLPAAIGVGVLLAGIVLGSLFLWRPAFVAVLAVGAAVGVWEMCRALAGAGRANPPLIPLLGGCVVMPVLAWYGGVESLILGLLVTVVAVMIWRLSGGAAGFQRDMTAATLIAVYVPFLISFGVLLAVPADGDLRVLAVACLCRPLGHRRLRGRRLPRQASDGAHGQPEEVLGRPGRLAGGHRARRCAAAALPL